MSKEFQQHKHANLHLKTDILQQYGLPDIPYPVPAALVQEALTSDGHLPFTLLLRGLQERSQDLATGWRDLEPAMDRLSHLLTPNDPRETVSAEGESWWLEIGPIDLEGKLVTIQRDGELIAAMTHREDGRLRAAVYRPLDGKSCEYLCGVGQRPYNGAVCMRENNWEYALDCSAGMGNVYASEAGEAYLSYWEKGIGISHDGTVLSDWRRHLTLVPRPAARVAMDLGAHHAYSADPDEPVEDEPEVLPPPVAATPTWTRKRQQARTIQNRFVGCLIGGAVGDALGAPIEFMKRDEIVRRFGSKGLTDYAPAYGGIGKVTDDTQMTLFTAEGLLRAHVRGCFKGITTYPGVTANAYVRWLKTQDERPPAQPRDDLDHQGWLFFHPELHSRRAPGNTCLSALRGTPGIERPADNDSKGCGGVMRVAPVGLYAVRAGWDAMQTFKLGSELAAITHGHPTGYLTGGALAVMIQAITDGASIREALRVAIACLEPQEESQETIHSMKGAEILADMKMPPEQAIRELGQGWVAEEALGISVYCALVGRTFREGVLLAVNHDGDSDSTGSITGNLLGALYGVKSIPQKWLEPLELREAIAELAGDLYTFKDWDIGEYSRNQKLNDQIWRKYPGG